MLKTEIEFERGDYVLVVWVDAWHSDKYSEEHVEEGLLTQTVGIFVKCGEEGLLLAESLYDWGDFARYRMFIPYAVIREIKKLTVTS